MRCMDTSKNSTKTMDKGRKKTISFLFVCTVRPTVISDQLCFLNLPGTKPDNMEFGCSMREKVEYYYHHQPTVTDTRKLSTELDGRRNY